LRWEACFLYLRCFFDREVLLVDLIDFLVSENLTYLMLF
jgi:hypothetical protein